MNAIAPILAEGSSAASRSCDIVAYVRSRLVDASDNLEHIHAVFLDAQNRFVGEVFLPGTGIASFRTRLRDVLASALGSEARGMIIAHNHPSGHCYPSRQDIEATHKLSQVACALDIELLDHLIITRESAYSMRARGEI